MKWTGIGSNPEVVSDPGPFGNYLLYCVTLRLRHLDQVERQEELEVQTGPKQLL